MVCYAFTDGVKYAKTQVKVNRFLTDSFLIQVYIKVQCYNTCYLSYC